MLKQVVLGFIICLSLQESRAVDRAFPHDYSKKRVLISTDIGGGDKDDTQSLIHFLAYANMFDVEGIVISRPRGHIREALRVIAAYEKDYPRFRFVSADYPTPEYLRSVIKVGARRMVNRRDERLLRTPDKGYSVPTRGSRLIVRAARKSDPRPLHILVWGSATDVAQALSNAQDIKSKVNLHLGGTGRTAYNYVFDPTPLNYLRRMSGLRMIDGTYGRGVWGGGLRKTSKYGNVGFVSQVIRPRGSLGRLFYQISESIDVNSYGLKMGDSGTVFFMMNGSYEAPWQPSWGGQYCPSTNDMNHFIMCDNPDLEYAGEPGALTVAKHRMKFLKDWESRLKMIYDLDLPPIDP